MTAHDCDQECPCGHWSPRVKQRGSKNADKTTGRVNLDLLDGAPDHDANYGDYDEDD